MSTISEDLGELSPEERELFELLLQQEEGEVSQSLIPHRRASEFVPLSFAQEQFWLIDQLEGGSAFYNVTEAFHLSGRLDATALEQSVNEIVRRHEVLRATCTTVNGQPIQSITPTLKLSLSVTDLQRLSETEREVRTRQFATEEARRPFDLARGPFLRVGLLRLTPEEHVLLLSTHHFVADGWSMRILMQELAVLYEAFSEGKPSPLPELSIQYADFAQWQREWAQQKEVLEAQIAYWKNQLDSAPVMLEFLTDRPQPSVKTYRGIRQPFVLSATLSEALRDLSRQEGVTLFMTLLAALQTLLHRYTAQDDIVVATSVSSRTRTDLEQMIGSFANTLLLRTDFSGNSSFRELLQRVRQVALGAYAHQELPFEKLVKELRSERDLNRSPLFQVMFVLHQGTLEQHLRLPGLTVRSLEVGSETTPFDLALSITEERKRIQGRLGYNTDLFDAVTIKRMLGHFQVLLEGIVADPDQSIRTLPLLTAAERKQLLHEWNDTRREYPEDQCVHQLFESQVERTPGQVALVQGARTLTYREVNEHANRWAHLLQKKGVKPETLVAVCMDRSPEVAIALLAILKAGGAFVSLDPDSPTERLHSMVQDTGAQLALTKQAYVERLEQSGVEVIPVDRLWHESAKEDAVTPASVVQSSNLAYAVYTSGSTGSPKGILVTHRSFVNFALAMSQKIGLSPADRQLQFAPVGSEPFIAEVWLSLLAGATLVVRPAQDFASVAECLHFLEENQITVTVLPSVYWHEWVTSMADGHVSVPSALRCLITGMDTVRADLLALWEQRVGGRIRWLNGYGPSEATCVATVYEADFSAHRPLPSVPIGRPLANTTIYLLDRHHNPVPIGVPGELYIGGHGVARGYLNRPELTAENFVPDRFGDDPHGRLYRTGDLARYLPDGNIEFLGRIDQQVKIRGFRVELGEVEAALRQHVREAVVVAREDEPNDKRLVAYVVARPDAATSTSALRGFLREKLPHHMIPSAFVFLDALPLTPSGKVDRQALPMPDRIGPGSEATFVAPRTPIEVTLAGIWAQVLGVDQVSVHDTFFDLGGHSLLSLKVVDRVEKELGLSISPRELVIQTLGQLAATCDERRQHTPQASPKRLTQRVWGAVKRTVLYRR